MQEIVTLVSSKGDPHRTQTEPNWARAPWLEQYYCPEVLKSSQGPRLLTTHLPYELLSSALRGSKAKVTTNHTKSIKDIFNSLRFLKGKE